MRWIIYFFFILFFTSLSYALSVQDITHITPSSNLIMVVSTPYEFLSSSSYNQTYLSSDIILKISIPLSQLSIDNKTQNTQTSDMILKISKPLSTLRIENITHTDYSNELIFNISEYNITQLLSNNSKYFSEFISSINSSIPIIIGKNSFDNYLIDKYDVGLQNGFVKYYDKIGNYPFNAVIISSTLNGNRTIFVYGTSIEGEIAGLRYLKNNIDIFTYNDKSVFLNDIDGLSIYDYMHLSENQKWYNTETKEFGNIINKSLFGKVEEDIIDVKTNEGVLLRVLEIESLNSDKLNDYRNNITLPVVFARGLWSNLFAWQEFGIKMADSGRKVYLIEITGGPGQDCSSCVNYNFSDLTLSYWPALIGTIQFLNNNSKIQYVGHSNGARTGISSLEIFNEIGKQNAGQYFNGSEWIQVNMTPNPVETYIAAGMPGAFEGVNPIVSGIKLLSNSINEKIQNNSLNHVSLFELGKFGLTAIKVASKNQDDKISVNLWNNYYFWMESENDSQPGKNVNLSNFLIMQGDILITSDGIVSTKDEEEIYSNILSLNKAHISLSVTHTGIADSKASKRIINSYLLNNNLEELKIKYTFQNITNQIYGGLIINETK